MNTTIEESIKFTYKVNRASVLLSSLSTFTQEQDSLIKKIKEINPELAEEMSIYGIKFWVLYNDRTSKTKHIETGIQIDTEMWYMSKCEVKKIYDSLDNKSKGLIQEYIYKFEEEVYKKTERLIEELGISYESLDVLTEF